MRPQHGAQLRPPSPRQSHATLILPQRTSPCAPTPAVTEATSKAQRIDSHTSTQPNTLLPSANTTKAVSGMPNRVQSGYIQGGAHLISFQQCYGLTTQHPSQVNVFPMQLFQLEMQKGKICVAVKNLHYKPQSWVQNGRRWRKKRRLRCPPLTVLFRLLCFRATLSLSHLNLASVNKSGQSPASDNPPCDLPLTNLFMKPD